MYLYSTVQYSTVEDMQYVQYYGDGEVADVNKKRARGTREE